ncbi:hypothetical protein JNL27_04805 [bacterium]|nr:hypothetical protein [bacterium]
MKEFSRLSILTLSIVFGLFIFSCSTDEEAGTGNFSSQQEAIDAVNDLKEQGFFDEVEGDLEQAADQATDFSPGYFKTKKEKGRLSKVRGIQDFVYGTDHFWTYSSSEDTTFNDTTLSGIATISLSADMLYKVRFTDRDNFGFPTATTELMEWIADFSFNTTSTGNGATTSFGISFDSDMDVNGIAGFNAGTGNLTIDGSGHQNFNLSSTSSQSSFEYDYQTSHNINSFALSPTGNYPESGTISFIAKRNVTPAVLQQVFPNFNVSGTITFNGTNIAVLEIGGYTFYINLDTEIITPA